jgi:hypothetical protein
MSRMLFAKGVHGELITKIQEVLNASGFNTKGIDGVFGENTRFAIEQFQKGEGNLDVTGEVDTDTYKALMGMDPPMLRDRSLQLTAAFEGHGFGLAQGNFDGAGITWGIIGFTLKHGEVKKIILSLNEINPALVTECFENKTEELLEVLNSSTAKQIAFADQISIGANKLKLSEPWRSSFMKFGGMPEVQKLQSEFANKDYFQPACQTAKDFKLNTELGVLLAFDIHVQNGGIKQSARNLIHQQLQDHPVGNERELRVIIANAVADKAGAEFREDVRARKTTIANGSGKVHGATFLLRNWGLDELDAVLD